jgi:hypothetical protein
MVAFNISCLECSFRCHAKSGQLSHADVLIPATNAGVPTTVRLGDYMRRAYIRRTVAETPRVLRIFLMSFGSLVRTVSLARTMKAR